MGYIFALVVLLVVVPIVFLLVTRRTTGGGGIDSRNRGMTVSKPSSDQPTPPADREGRVPPG